MRRALIPGAGLAAVAVLGFFVFRVSEDPRAQQPIRVGVLHSSTGTMAVSEAPVIAATLASLEQINAQGGLLGRRIEPVVRDGASDPEVFAREAGRLITADRVAVIFGCWTSAARRMVRPVLEQHNALMFYPLPYEGIEQSPNIVYVGSTPNQQIIPGVSWAREFLGRRFFLVGSDYVFPRVSHAIIRDLATMLGGQVVGEEYIPLGSHDVAAVVARIDAARPDVIFNSISDGSNGPFFAALAATSAPRRIPVMSFSVGEAELAAMDPAAVEEHYAVWNYFQTLPGAENERFVALMRARLGDRHPVSDPMEAAHVGVRIWAMAVADARSTTVDAVRGALGDQSLPAPQGVVYVDGPTQHTWKRVRIGKARRDRQFDVVWDSGTTVRPMPYPFFRTRDDWDRLIRDLQSGWGGGWQPDSRLSRK